MKLVDYLKWPSSGVFAVTMTKKVLREVLEPERKEDLLSSIEKMTWSGVLKPHQVQIPAFIDEEFYYDEIVFVEVNLREKEFADRVARLLQRVVPYPLVIGFAFKNEFCFQIAEKAIHKQQKEKRVVNQEKFFFSEWMCFGNFSDQQKTYLTNLSLDKVGGTHLKEYFDKLMHQIYDKHRQDQIALLSLEKDAQKCKNEYAKERNISRKAEIHHKCRKIADQIKALKNRIK